jgi:PKD repeat protein
MPRPVFNNRLYIGTINWANGGEVWKKTVTADFTASPTVGSPGTTVTFTNLAGGDVLTTTWNFGDGSPALTVTHTDPVTHTYTTPGVYTVTLTVEDGVDTDVRTRTAYIQIAHRIFLPLVLRAYNPLIALYDDFNNPAFDGFYNPLKWRFWGDENYFSARQQGGVLVITNTPSTPANVGLDLPLAMPMERTLRQVQRFQARMIEQWNFGYRRQDSNHARRQRQWVVDAVQSERLWQLAGFRLRHHELHAW